MLRPTRKTKPPNAILAAFHALAPGDEATINAMLRMLGHSEAEARTAVRKVSNPVQQGSQGVGSPDMGNKRLQERGRPARESEVRRRIVLESELIRDDGSAPPAPPEWLANTILLSFAAPSVPAYRKRMPPLFPPRQERSLIFSLAARRIVDAAIDVEAAAQAMARLTFADRIPHRSRRSIRRGACVLVDLGESMQPFAFDTLALAQQFQAVVGRGQVDVRYFRGHPHDGLIDPESGLPMPWRGLPGANCPVFIITDFGLAGAAGRWRSLPRTRSWLAFARELAEAGRRPTAIVPYPKHRLPAALAGSFDCVEWSRHVRFSGRAGE